MTDERIRISQTLALQIIVWIVAGLLTYSAVNARVAVLESQMQQYRQDVQEIKADLKALLRR